MSEPISDDLQTEELAETVDWLSFQKFRVRVIGGPDANREAVADSELSIGTSDGNELVLTDTTVSRHHATIVGDGAGFMLRDLDSTNGTRLGGYRIEGAQLKPGATFKIGRSTLTFETLEERVQKPVSAEQRYGELVGGSVAMRRLFAMLPRIARSLSTVLIEGETGTGKGALAAAIHQDSQRADAPFVVLDCASVAPTLIESHMFGHVRGAFSGATDDRPGAFVAANGGTLFLDEIGELPLDVQPKLLRVLEERVVVPVGSVAERPVDVRVVAATNRDLRSEVNRGAFRADLFYRLHVVRLEVPPLRDRREDIPVLIEHFRRQIAPDSAPLSDSIVEAWKSLRWSGNARELRGAVERHLLLGDDAYETVARTTDEAAPFDPRLSFRAAKELAVAKFERAYLGALVERHGGNLSQAARAARMDRNHLRHLLRRHEIEVKR
jgi:DNA-binding NtrC family response regulator